MSTPPDQQAERTKEPETHAERWAREDAAALAEILHDTWFPRHPMGGNEIYRNGDTKKNLAEFSNEAECNRAIECHNALAGVSDPGSAIRAAREALEAMLASARPSRAEHPKMFAAWKLGESALAALLPASDTEGTR